MTQTAPIPGLSEHTTTGALITALRTLPQRPLQFHLHGTLLVPAGYHVTEIKAVTIEAMDCGGHANAWRETVIQLMDGNAEEAGAGFMTNRKFLAIYDRVTRHIPVRAEAEVRVEYGNASNPAVHYHITHVDHQPDAITVHLRPPGVQCKAGDACGLPTAATSDHCEPASGLPTAATSDHCEPASGCCAPQAPITLD